MARYNGPVCRLCRAEGTKLYLKGDRCSSVKCAFEKKPSKPGMAGASRMRRKQTDYGMQLREKQKVRRIYGILEKQFRIYFKLAAKAKGITGENLLQILERRLDNVVYKAGLAPSRNAARQLIKHGHFSLNNHKVNIPSILVAEEDFIEVKEKSKSVKIINQSLEAKRATGTQDWLALDAPKYSVKVLRLPERIHIDNEINEQMIVELYSR